LAFLTLLGLAAVTVGLGASTLGAAVFAAGVADFLATGFTVVAALTGAFLAAVGLLGVALVFMAIPCLVNDVNSINRLHNFCPVPCPHRLANSVSMSN